MKPIIIAIAALVLLTGCGKTTSNCDQAAITVPGPTVTVTPIPVVQDTQDIINGLVASENQYREGLGQTYLTAGLSCTLQTTTGGYYINATSLTGASQSPTLTGIKTVATFLLTTSFNQPDTSVSTGLNILPVALQSNPLYQNNILVTCSGQFVAPTTDFYDFDSVSDDGSLVYFDGAELIDNDGAHSARDVSGTKYLRAGVHTFTLKFSQSGAGSQALTFSLNGTVVDPMYFYH